MRNVLVDSNIIIYLSKGLLNIEEILLGYEGFFISIITYMEVLGFQFSNQEEINTIKELLNYFHIENITPEIAETVISYKQKKKIKLPDAIILATAQIFHYDLLTRDIKDFKNITDDVILINPFGPGK